MESAVEVWAMMEIEVAVLACLTKINVVGARSESIHRIAVVVAVVVVALVASWRGLVIVVETLGSIVPVTALHIVRTVGYKTVRTVLGEATCGRYLKTHSIVRSRGTSVFQRIIDNLRAVIVQIIKQKALRKADGNANIESLEIEQSISMDFPKVFVALVFSRERFVLNADEISWTAVGRTPEGKLLGRVEGFDVTL